MVLKWASSTRAYGRRISFLAKKEIFEIASFHAHTQFLKSPRIDFFDNYLFENLYCGSRTVDGSTDAVFEEPLPSKFTVGTCGLQPVPLIIIFVLQFELN